MAAAFIFPGQGSQAVGMGKALAEAFAPARAVFEEVDAALGEKLSAIMWEGPADKLTLTENAQPALMAVSLAVMRVLEAEAGINLAARCEIRRRPFARRIFRAGGGRGVFAVRRRAAVCARAGARCSRRFPSAPARWRRCSGLSFDDAAAVAREAAQGQVCQAANDNGAGQVVVSGDKAAVERAVEIAKAKGAKRAMLLPVSAPFHCALMKPAADAMAQALAKITVKAPVVPVVANVLAKPVSDPAEIVRRSGRAGDRHGALARVRRVHGGRGREDILRSGRGQGAHGPGQAHRGRSHRHGDRHAGRCRGLQDRARLK